MRSLQYNRRSTEKLTVKGAVGQDGSINYVDDVGELKVVNFVDVLKMFAGQDVSVAVQMITDEDLLEDGELPVIIDEDDDGGLIVSEDDDNGAAGGDDGGLDVSEDGDGSTDGAAGGEG